MARWSDDNDHRRSRVGPITDVTTLYGAELDWRAFAAFLEGPDLDGARRLAVIREADRVSPEVWARFLHWARSADSELVERAHLLATAHERWPATDTDDPRYGVFVQPPRDDRKYPRGVYVECRPLSREGQIRYICTYFGEIHRRAASGADLEQVATLLVDRCGGDLVRLRSEKEKLEFFVGAGPLTLAKVAAVAVPSPGEAFVEALMAGRRGEAAARAPYVGSVRFVLGSLDWHLSALFLIRQALTVHRSRAIRDIAEYSRLDPFVVRRLKGLARTYDLTTTRRRYAALIMAQRTSRSTDDPSRVLVPLVAVW